MATERYYAGFYWGPRKETSQECANRTQAFLRAIAERDPLYASWHVVGDDLANTPVHSSRDFLEALLVEGRNRTDIEGEVIPELGFSLSLWSDAQETCVGLTITCGVYSQWVKNACSMDLPAKGAPADRILRASVLADMTRLFVRCWEPDYGVVTSFELGQLATSRDEEDEHASVPDVGWITYLSDVYRAPPRLPPPTWVESVEGQGHMIIAAGERLTVARPDHLQLLRSLDNRLDLRESGRKTP